MKTYYDLTKKERKEYKKEFRETPVAKEMHFTYKCIFVLVCCFSFIWGFSSGLMEGAEIINDDFQLFSNIMGIIAIVLAVIGTIWECYIIVSFSSWLKYKHKINRW